MKQQQPKNIPSTGNAPKVVPFTSREEFRSRIDAGINGEQNKIKGKQFALDTVNQGYRNCMDILYPGVDFDKAVTAFKQDFMGQKESS